MLGIENSRLRSVPEYRHCLAHSLAGNLFLINSHSGRGERTEKIKGGSHNSIIRQIETELLYCFGRLTGTEIREMMGVNYSTVSQERKRLQEKQKRDKSFSEIVKKIEADLS